MPGGNQTGPRGMGRMTGRAAGYCAGFEAPGYQRPVPGRGFGRGFCRSASAMDYGFGGGGRGWRNRFYATRLPGWMRFGGYDAPYKNAMSYDKPDPKLERETLRNQAEILRSELERIETRLAAFKEGTGEKGAQ
jgi:hypothetical protein